MDGLIAWGPVYASILGGWIGAPVSLGLAWWYRARRVSNRPAQSGRTHVLLSGLIAGSANVVMAWVWFTYRLLSGPRSEVWKLRDACGSIGIYLTLFAILAAIFGRGQGRVALLSCGVLGFLIWSEFGIL